MALMRTFLCVVAAFLGMLLVANVPAGAAEPINAAVSSARVDITPALEWIESPTPTATIELPAAASGTRQPVALQGRGPGPVYRWAFFTLRNGEAAEQDLVLVIPHQDFAGSGFRWPRPVGSRLAAVQSSSGEPVLRLTSPGADAIAIRVPPAATVAYALEAKPLGLGRIGLWQRSAFDANMGEIAFFRGVILGIAILLAITITGLFIIKPKAEFPAAAVFAWAAVGFLVIEGGYLGAVIDRFPQLAGSGQKLRAMVESLMVAGLAAALFTLLDLRRRIPTVGAVLMLVAGAAVALAIYGWLQPFVAAGVARLAFAAVVLVGLVAIVALAFQGIPRARIAMLTWVLLTLWTGTAAAAALGLGASDVMRPLVSAGLALVLVAMGFTLARLAFNYGMVSSRYFEEAGRRALALAASEQAVWDWQVEPASLFVGPELDRALGFQPGTIEKRNLKGWLELVHPADRAAYVGAVEAAEMRGRGTFSHDFRLRRADGTYRWFLLRARAVPGEETRAARLIGTLSDVTALRHSEDQLLADAIHDRVTGLPNRALFLDRLHRSLRRAESENDLGLYVIVVDLDRFKSVNEGLGHEIGDSLLSVTGRRLTALIGPEDTLGRLFGDQFGIIFNSGKPKREITRFAEELRDALSRPISVRPRDVTLTASVGIARFRLERQGPEDMLKDAEIALYEAKRRGKGGIEFFRPDMRDERSRLVSLEQDLRQALERSEIEVLYQPIMRLQGRELMGFEALMRWRRGAELLGPDDFIRVAEEADIMRDLGRHVLTEAIRQVGIWHRSFRPQKPLFVAVNVSSAELLTGELVEEVRTLLGREDLRPATLTLEITESLIMQNPELTDKVLDRLRQMGVGLACDDFGTGYSSLANLRRLPFSSIKIDKAFLDENMEDERAAVVLESMVLLAHDLGLTVVAEGIENEEQLERLAAMGCEAGQGFFIGTPVSSRQVIDALGGLPYSVGTRRAGMAAFWDRMVRLGKAGRAAVPQPPATATIAPVEALPTLVPKAPAPPGVVETTAEEEEPQETSEEQIELFPAEEIEPAEVLPRIPEVGTAPFAPRRVHPLGAKVIDSKRVPGEAVPAEAEPTSDAAVEPEPAAASEDALSRRAGHKALRRRLTRAGKRAGRMGRRGE